METKQREILLRTMKDFMAFCDIAGLKWYLAYGSAIGAVATTDSFRGMTI